MKKTNKRLFILVLLCMVVTLNVNVKAITNTNSTKKTVKNIDTWLEPQLQKKVLKNLIQTGALEYDATVQDITKELITNYDSGLYFDWDWDEEYLPSFKGLELFKKAAYISIDRVKADENTDFSALYDLKNIMMLSLHPTAKVWDFKTIAPIFANNPDVIMDIRQTTLTTVPAKLSINQTNYKKFSLAADKVLIPYFAEQFESTRFATVATGISFDEENGRVFGDKIRYNVSYNKVTKQYDFVLDQETIDNNFEDEPTFEELFKDVLDYKAEGNKPFFSLHSQGFHAIPEYVYSYMQYGKFGLQSEIEVNESTVLARYLDEGGQEIAQNEKFTGVTGTGEYTTIQKEINDYSFVKSEGQTSGKFGADNQVVTYYYQKNSVDVEPEPTKPETTKSKVDNPKIGNKISNPTTKKKLLPETGSNNLIYVVAFTAVMGMGILISKKIR